MTLLGGRYRLLERLGAGSLGEVWRAADELDEREVALKRLLCPESAVPRMRDEFRSAIGLHHPHIAAPFDFYSEPGAAPFFTMELVVGGSLTDAARGASIAQVLGLAGQVAEALVYLDGRVHGDLKPSNVLVGDGVVKLVDFGMAAIPAGDELSGTPEYLAPEVIRGAPKDGRSDLYAFGVMLYELLAGVSPFAAGTIVEALARQLEHVPTPLCEVRGDVGLDLSAFVERLMRKDPALRFQSAREVKTALESLLAADVLGAARGPRAVVGTPVLVGRAALVARLDAAVETLRAGGEVRLHLCGPEGSGRTRLAEHLRVQATLAGIRAVRVRAQGDGGDGERLARAQAAGAALLIVDDAERLDAAAAGALAGAVQATVGATRGVLLIGGVGAWRSYEASAERMSLGPLGADDSEALIASALGAPVDRATLTLPLQRAAGGWPGETLRLLRALAAAGALRWSNGRWQVDAAPEAVVVPAHREQAVAQARVAATLGHWSRVLALLADVSAPLGATPGEDTRLRIEALARCGRSDEARALLPGLLGRGPENDLSVVRVARALGELELARRAAALGLGDLARRDDPALAGALLRELATLDWQGGRIPEAIAHASRALAIAEQAGDARAEAESAMTLATCHRMAGSHALAVELYRDAARRFVQLGALASLGKAHNNAAVCYYLLGRVDEAAEAWREAIRAAETSGELIEQMILLNNIGFMYLERGAFPNAERAFEEALRRAASADAPQIACTVRGNLGEVRVAQRRHDDARALFTSAIALAESNGSRGDVLENRRRLAELALREGDAGIAGRLARDVLAEAESLGVAPERVHALRIAALAAARRGELDEAARALDGAHALSDDEASLDRLRLHLATAQVALIRGDLQEARRAATVARTGFERLGAGWYLAEARQVLGAVEERTGRAGRPQRSDVVLATIDSLSATWNPEECARITLQAVLEVSGAERVTIYCEPAPGHDALRASTSRADGAARDPSPYDMREAIDNDPRGPTTELSRTVVSRVLERGEPICLTRIEDDAALASAASVIAMRLHSALCVPVPLAARSTGPGQGQEAAGLVYADSRVPVGGRFERALPLISTLARAFGMALDRIRLRERMQSQAEVVSVVAHEMRSPLTSIIGYGELARMSLRLDESIGEDVLLLIEAVGEQGERMRRLIDDVESLGQAWRYSLQAATRVAPRALAEVAAAELGPTLTKAGLSALVRADDELPDVTVDKGRVSQVLVNLLSNASRYAPRETAIEIAVEREPFVGRIGERPKVRFTVRDRGPGVSEADAARIFQRFNRGSRPRGEGSGLGLSIAQAIVLAHGGDIWVVPSREGGLFCFTLPVCGDDEA